LLISRKHAQNAIDRSRTIVTAASWIVSRKSNSTASEYSLNCIADTVIHATSEFYIFELAEFEEPSQRFPVFAPSFKGLAAR